jgi:hypothetical protein
MAAYAAHFSPLLENELRSEQAKYKATTCSPETSGSIFRGLRIAKDGQLFRQMQYVLWNIVRSMRLEECSLIGKGNVVYIRISDVGGNEQVQNNRDEALTAAEASALERNSWTLTVTTPLGAESARILNILAQVDVALDVLQGTNALAYERAIVALIATTDKSEEQSLVVNTRAPSLQPTSPSLPSQESVNRSVQKSLSSSSDKETHTEISAGIDDDESEFTRSTNRLHAEFLNEPSALFFRILRTARQRGGFPKNAVCGKARRVPRSVPNSNLPAVEQAVCEISGINIPLNSAQRAALCSSLSKTKTLVQISPCTGKTQTAARMVIGTVLAGCGPVLATASSNVPVDNQTESLPDLKQHSLLIVGGGPIGCAAAAALERVRESYTVSVYESTEEPSTETSAADAPMNLIVIMSKRGARSLQIIDGDVEKTLQAFTPVRGAVSHMRERRRE